MDDISVFRELDPRRATTQTLHLRTRTKPGTFRFVPTTRVADSDVIRTLRGLTPAQVRAELETVRQEKADLETYESLLQLVLRWNGPNEDTNGKQTTSVGKSLAMPFEV